MEYITLKSRTTKDSGTVKLRFRLRDGRNIELYAENAMPVELLKAHRANDAAVLEAYGFSKDATESDIVARLFKMYQELTK